MAQQEQIKKPAPQVSDSKGRYAKQTEHAEVPVEVTDEAQALKDEMDAILDEIDSVLEENAQEFVSQYVQKGGE